MLRELHIRNLALIEEQVVPFRPGLNVISGETGAGKSMLLHAVELILGARPSVQLIRSGADALELDALFDLAALDEEVRRELPDIARADELLISRTLARSGKGKVFINGRLATVAMLEEVTSRLINICGQNQHVRLLQAAYHRELVDGFGDHGALLANYREVYDRWRALRRKIEELDRSRDAQERERRELESIVEDLEPLNVVAGERAELEARVRALSNAEHVTAGAAQIAELCGSDEGLLAMLSTIGGRLSELTRLDPGLSPLSAHFGELRAGLLEFERDFTRYASQLSVDADTLEELRDRLAEIARVERKYRRPDAELVALLADAKRRLLDLADPRGAEELKLEAQQVERQLEQLSTQLSTARREAGSALAELAQRELAELAMPDTTLVVEVTHGAPGPDGGDVVELLLSTNRGEPVKPLRAIASGGELARITLVLKKLLRERSGVNVLVFDEVDTGVSGGVARAVGEKLRALAAHSQVICITHLAQVASLADAHLLVTKKVSDRTTSEVCLLSREQRVEEVARMLAGYRVTEAARESARELLSSK